MSTDALGNVVLPGEVVAVIPDVDTAECECGAKPVLVDRFLIQYLDVDTADRSVVSPPMFVCRVCWDREIAGTDNNHRYGVIPIRIALR